MWTWIKEFLFDRTAFFGLIRALAMGAGGALILHPDLFDVLPKWTGVVLLMLAGYMRSSSSSASSRNG